MFYDPKFWLAISFIIFILVIVKYALPIILKKIDNQSDVIAKNIKEAEALKIEAEKLLKKSKEYFDESVKYGDQIILDSKNESDKIIEDNRSFIEREISKKISLAKERIKINEDSIIREVKTKIIESAIISVAQNINKNIDSKSVSKISKDSIGQVSSKLIN